MYGYIYKRQNKLNGKIYIGQHKYDKPMLDESYRGSGIAFLKALKKYGDNSFTYELIDIANSLDELNILENFYIQKYDCFSPNGYNLREGGNGKLVCIESKQKISNRVKQLWKNEDYRDRTIKSMSKSHIGKPSNMKGRKFTGDELNRFRDNSLGRSWYTDGKVEVFQYECPEGFTKGRISSEKFNSNEGNIWVTDGINTVSCNPNMINDYLAMGYTYGRTLNYSHSDEYKRKMSEKYSGNKNPMYGKKYISISRDGVKKRVPEEQLQNYLLDGWIKGWSHK